jgi:hypothetical protein
LQEEDEYAGKGEDGDDANMENGEEYDEEYRDDQQYDGEEMDTVRAAAHAVKVIAHLTIAINITGKR